MPRTPTRAGLAAPEDSRYPSEVLAENIRGYRALRHLKQDDLASLMSRVGHGWHRTTLSEVERGGRAVDVDELVSLALILEVTIGSLLDPAGPDGSRDEGLFVGTADSQREVVPQPEARAIAHSVTPVRIERHMTLLPDEPDYQVKVVDEARFRRWLESRGPGG